MSKVSEFYEALSNDEAMQERANALKNAIGSGESAEAESVIAFAKDEGYSFTLDDLKDFMSRGLSEEEMKAVAAGDFGGSSTGSCFEAYQAERDKLKRCGDKAVFCG